MSKDERLSGAMRIFEAFSGVDAGLLEDSERRKVPFRWHTMHGLAAAACVVILVGAVWWLQPNLIPRKAFEADCTAGAVDTAPEQAVEESFASATIADGYSDREASDRDALTQESMEENAVEDAKGVQYSVAENENTESGSSSHRTELEKETGKNKDHFNIQQELMQSDVIPGSIPADMRKELALEEAEAVEVLGAYVPTVVPKGYCFETAKASVNEKTKACEVLMVCWTRGMDSIMITISEKESEDLEEDVLAAGDLTKEIIEKIMKTVADVGDTDTPRGSFAVYYEEGVLVRFSGRGTAQEIWELFCSMGK